MAPGNQETPPKSAPVNCTLKFSEDKRNKINNARAYELQIQDPTLPSLSDRIPIHFSLNLQSKFKGRHALSSLKASFHDAIFEDSYYPNSKNLVT